MAGLLFGKKRCLQLDLKESREGFWYFETRETVPGRKPCLDEMRPVLDHGDGTRRKALFR